MKGASNYNDLATEEDGSCQYCDIELSVDMLQALTCAGDNNASAELTLLGVTAPDSIEIYLDDVLQDTTLFEGLSAGTTRGGLDRIVRHSSTSRWRTASPWMSWPKSRMWLAQVNSMAKSSLS